MQEDERADALVVWHIRRLMRTDSWCPLGARGQIVCPLGGHPGAMRPPLLPPLIDKPFSAYWVLGTSGGGCWVCILHCLLLPSRLSTCSSPHTTSSSRSICSISAALALAKSSLLSNIVFNQCVVMFALSDFSI